MRYRSLIPVSTGGLGCETQAAILTHGFLFERPALRFDQNLVRVAYHPPVGHPAIDGKRGAGAEQVKADNGGLHGNTRELRQKEFDFFNARESLDALEHAAHFGSAGGAAELRQPLGFFFKFAARKRIARIAFGLIDSAV